jgi:DNA-binding transcriptional LysR family regulator
MDLRQLRYFAIVAEEGHVTRAAAVLEMQQPPLSQQIRALEQELGVVLFRRHAKGMALTEAGRLMLQETRLVLAAAEQLRARMRSVAEGRRGLLSIGFTSSAAAHGFVPAVLRACRSEFPELELRISENNAAEIIEAVAAERMHCGVVRAPVAHPEGVHFELLLEERLMLVLPVGHPLTRRYATARTVPLEALRGERLILVRRSGAPGMYSNLLAALAARGVEVTVAAEVERMMTNINLVAAGEGISVVPASMEGAHGRAVAYRRLPADPRLMAPITLVYRDHDRAGTIATFVELARRTAHELRSTAPRRHRRQAPA